MRTLGQRHPRNALSFVACVLLVACAGDVGSSRDGQTASADVSPTPGTSAVSSNAGATEPPDGAPRELAGRWRRNVQGETVILTLDGTGYHIQRGPASGSGRIAVDGDEIEFYGSNLCDGQGTYTWSFEEGRLRFTEIVADPCDGRTVVLLRGTFGPVDP
jgi:hypothetical protein